MRLMKGVLKIAVFPLILVLGALSVIAKVVTNLSCYIVGPFMLFLAGCMVYTMVMQMWNQVAILAVLLVGCFVLLFGAAWVIVTLEDIMQRLISI